MKKKVIIAVFSLVVIGIIIVFIYLNINANITGITGNVIKASAGSEIIRNVEQLKINEPIQVSLEINSDKRSIAVIEGAPEDWEILDYSMNPEFEIFDFKPSENTWIIADKEKEIKGVLTYTAILKKEGIVEGSYSYLDNNGNFATKAVIGDGTSSPILKVKLTPEELNYKEILNIRISPGKDGIKDVIHIHKYFEEGSGWPELYPIIGIKFDCSGRCYEPISYDYLIPSSWPAGRYYLRIHDYDSGENKKFDFVIKEGARSVEVELGNISLGEEFTAKVIPTDLEISRYASILKEELYKGRMKTTNRITINCPHKKNRCEPGVYSARAKISEKYGAGNYILRLYEYEFNEKRDRYVDFPFVVFEAGKLPPQPPVKIGEEKFEFSLAPKELDTRDTLYIHIEPGKEGFAETLDVYKRGVDTRKAKINLLCKGVCKKVIDYRLRIPSDWTAGEYYVQVLDYNEPIENRLKEFDFKIINGKVYKNLSLDILTKEVKAGEEFRAVVKEGGYPVLNNAFIQSKIGGVALKVSLCGKELSCMPKKGKEIKANIPKDWPSGDYLLVITEIREEGNVNREFEFKIIPVVIEPPIEETPVEPPIEEPKKEFSVILDKNRVKVGETLTITINSGEKGIYQVIGVFEGNRIVDTISLRNVCEREGSKCVNKEEFSAKYKIPSKLKAGKTYKLKIRDYNDNPRGAYKEYEFSVYK